MILAPMMASSRLGLVTDLLLIVGVVPILHLAMHNMMQKLVLWGGVLCLVIGGLCLGWQYLAPRLESNAFEQSWEQRKIVSENADRISDDYPVFGTGPGSFRAMYQYYMQGSDDWVAQVHNDYVETVVTFGWVGVFLLLALLVSLPIRWLIPGGISMGRRFPLLLYMGLGSCLFQARWDFPFQIYSILFLFLVVGAIASTLTRRRIA
jgi:O-antigen ligase